MNSRGIRLVIAALALYVPLAAQSAKVEINPCDTPGGSTWMKLGDCEKGTRLLAWPLLQLDATNKPVVMPIGACLRGAAECGFGSNPQAWSLGSVGPETVLQPPPQAFDAEWNRRPNESWSDVLMQVSRQTRVAELAWRLGAVPSSAPVFILHQRTGREPAKVGDCGQLEVGSLIVENRSYQIRSECRPDLAGEITDEVFRKLLVDANAPFTWTLSDGPASPPSAGEAIRLVLFPYQVTQRTLGRVGLGEYAQPASGATVRTLVSFSVRVPEERKQTPTTETQGGNHIVDIIVALAVIGTAVVVVIILRGKGLLSNSKPSNPASPSSEGPAATASSVNDATTLTGSPGRTEADSELRNILDRLAVLESQLPGSQPSGDVAALSTRVRTIEEQMRKTPQNGNKKAKELETLEERLKQLFRAELSNSTNNLNSELRQCRTELTSKVQEIAELWKALNGAKAAAQSTLQKLDQLEEQAALADAAVESIEGTLKDKVAEHWEAYRRQYYVFEPVPIDVVDGRPVPVKPPPIFEAKAGVALKRLDEISTLAFDLLRAWLGECKSPPRAAASDALADTTIEAYHALEAVAHSDRLLWKWCLGKFPATVPGTLASAVDQARTKWLPASLAEPITAVEFSKVVLRWSDDRIPHLQTLIDAVPFDSGQEDPLKLRKALGIAAQQLCGDQQFEVSVGSLSERFHDLVTALFKAANADYVRVRLYEDKIQTGDLAAFVAATHAAYAFPQSATLIDRGVANEHGAVVRVRQPISKRPDRSGQIRWEGSLYYLEALKS